MPKRLARDLIKNFKIFSYFFLSRSTKSLDRRLNFQNLFFSLIGSQSYVFSPFCLSKRWNIWFIKNVDSRIEFANVGMWKNTQRWSRDDGKEGKAEKNGAGGEEIESRVNCRPDVTIEMRKVSIDVTSSRYFPPFFNTFCIKFFPLKIFRNSSTFLTLIDRSVPKRRSRQFFTLQSILGWVTAKPSRRNGNWNYGKGKKSDQGHEIGLKKPPQEKLIQHFGLGKILKFWRTWIFYKNDTFEFFFWDFIGIFLEKHFNVSFL